VKHFIEGNLNIVSILRFVNNIVLCIIHLEGPQSHFAKMCHSFVQIADLEHNANRKHRLTINPVLCVEN
jgi:hypothetical protein